MPAKLHLGFISDFLCPWCFIGYKHLDNALSQSGSQLLEFPIRIYPLSLYPELPLDGMSKSAFAQTTRKGIGRILITEALEVGIDLHLGKIDFIPNTFEAHRAIMSLQDPVQQWKATRLIFEAYFVQGINISSQETVSSILVNSDLSPTIWISKEMLSERIKHTQSYFIQTTPSFILDEQHIISGVQDTQKWVNYFSKKTN